VGTSRWTSGLLVAVAAVLGDCNGDDSEANQDASDTADFSHLEKCEDYFGDGVILRAAEGFDLAGCVTADGQPAFYNETFRQCADGRTLYWSDPAGWGYDGEPWHADASGPPAEALASCAG
jgi:hypothetical protein